MKSLNDEFSSKNIEKKLDLIHKDIKKIIEESNKSYLEQLSNSIKNDYLDRAKKYLKNENVEVLNQKMVNSCDYKKDCEKIFNQYLEKSLKELNPDNVSQDTLNRYKNELNELKQNAKFTECNICFEGVSNIFLKQYDLINSLKSYEKTNEIESSEIDVEYFVEEILFPIANKQRLEILKSIYLEPKTFSELSKITNLRGGNLIFHIEKLQEKDFIFQKSERSSYLLTKKGFKIMNLLKNMNNKELFH